MRPQLALLLALASIPALAGCVQPSVATPASDPAPPPPAQAELYSGRHTFDAAPVGETEEKCAFDVPEGATGLVVKVAWSSKTGAAAGGVEVKLKDPDGKTQAEAEIGSGPLPADFTKNVDARPGRWIVEYEGFAPDVKATVTVATL